MKVLQLTTRKVSGYSEVNPLELGARRMREWRGRPLVVNGRDETPIRSIPDRELASAAFAQAVALYECCVQYAQSTQLASEPSCEGIGAA